MHNIGNKINKQNEPTLFPNRSINMYSRFSRSTLVSFSHEAIRWLRGNKQRHSASVALDGPEVVEHHWRSLPNLQLTAAVNKSFGQINPNGKDHPTNHSCISSFSMLYNVLLFVGLLAFRILQTYPIEDPESTTLEDYVGVSPCLGDPALLVVWELCSQATGFVANVVEVHFFWGLQKYKQHHRPLGCNEGRTAWSVRNIQKHRESPSHRPLNSQAFSVGLRPEEGLRNHPEVDVLVLANESQDRAPW